MIKSLFWVISLLVLLSSCASHYELIGISRSRILIDSAYDKVSDTKAVTFMAPYKARVDSIMSPIVGKVATYM